MAGFVLVALGADCVQRRGLSATAAWAGVSHALLVANLLYVNQFPDRAADGAAGKMHWVARLPVPVARWGYVLLLGASVSVLVAGAARGVLPPSVVWTAPAYLLGSVAAARVLRDASEPARLAPAIVMTILTALLHALLLAMGLAVRRI